MSLMETMNAYHQAHSYFYAVLVFREKKVSTKTNVFVLTLSKA